MKNLILILFSIINLVSFGQITLEHTYTNASTLADSIPSEDKQPLMVHLEVDGMKYVFIDRPAKTVNFYNLDHTFFKSISYAASTNISSLVSADILYISQHLFDLDDEIEFMYSNHYSTGSNFTCITQIINEDGSVIFSENGAPFVRVNYPQQQYPIYTTNNGTKLMLSMNNTDVNIYSLQGDLSTLIVPLIDDSFLKFAYPNPSKNEITIPINNVNKEEKIKLEVFDLNGSLVKEVQLNPDIVELKLNIEDLSSGTFYYQITSDSNKSELRKFIKLE